MKLIKGKKYYLKNEGDLMLCSTFRTLIKQSIPLEFIRLTYSVPKRSLMEM